MPPRSGRDPHTLLLRICRTGGSEIRMLVALRAGYNMVSLECRPASLSTESSMKAGKNAYSSLQYCEQ